MSTKRKTQAIAIIFTLFVTWFLGYVSINHLGEYGWTIFIFIPILIGYLPPFLVSRKEKISRKYAFQLSFSTLGIACIALLIFAIEGLICVAMAAPILAFATFLGSYVAFILQDEKRFNQRNITIILVLIAFAFMSFDMQKSTKNLIEVTTTVHIDSNIHNVWSNVVTFEQIPTPTDWIFKTGIAYPIDATIEGTGVGAVRYCNFTTGSFVEPITKWEEPYSLQFDVEKQPIPMTELNPFWEVHPPHLEGYFNSRKGQFELKKISKDETELIGTTWYEVDIKPQFYWKIWTDFIIHKIHKRVLNHIKVEVERKSIASSNNQELNEMIATNLTSMQIDTLNGYDLINETFMKIASMRNVKFELREDFIKRIPKELRLVYAFWILHMNVKNGGFYQYYHNTEGKLLDLTLEAVQDMEMNKVTEIIKKVNIHFADKNLDLDSEDEQLEKAANGLWMPDEEYYSLDEEKDIYIPIANYIKANKEKFITRQ